MFPTDQFHPDGGEFPRLADRRLAIAAGDPGRADHEIGDLVGTDQIEEGAVRDDLDAVRLGQQVVNCKSRQDRADHIPEVDMMLLLDLHDRSSDRSSVSPVERIIAVPAGDLDPAQTLPACSIA